MARTKKSIATYPVELMFAASAAADRINGGKYHKITIELDDKMVQVDNRTLIEQALLGDLEITDSDRAFGESMLLHFQGLLFKLLADEKRTSDFEKKVFGIVSGEQATERDIAVVAALPTTYAIARARQQVNNRLADCQSAFIGKTGDRVTVDIEVVKSYYNNESQWGGYNITAITSENHRIGFMTDRQLKVGDRLTITARVKSQYLPTSTTYVNYVKVVSTTDA